MVLNSNPIRVKGEVLDLRGQQYGELTVIDFSKKDKQGRAIWKCLCSCGVTKDIRAQGLRSGAVISCGHIARQKSAKRMSCLNRTKDGASREDWYSNYNSMCHRILHGTQEDKKYYNSERINGVLLEPAWIDDPWMFYDEIGSKPGPDYTIDRIDSHKGYIPWNVRWANKHTQSVNQDRRPQGKVVMWEFKYVRKVSTEEAEIATRHLLVLTVRKLILEHICSLKTQCVCVMTPKKNMVTIIHLSALRVNLFLNQIIHLGNTLELPMTKRENPGEQHSHMTLTLESISILVVMIRWKPPSKL